MPPPRSFNLASREMARITSCVLEASKPLRVISAYLDYLSGQLRGRSWEYLTRYCTYSAAVACSVHLAQTSAWEAAVGFESLVGEAAL